MYPPVDAGGEVLGFIESRSYYITTRRSWDIYYSPACYLYIVQNDPDEATVELFDFSKKRFGATWTICHAWKSRCMFYAYFDERTSEYDFGDKGTIISVWLQDNVSLWASLKNNDVRNPRPAPFDVTVAATLNGY